MNTAEGDLEQIEVELPSGMRGSFRGLIGLDYRVLNRQSVKTGDGWTKVLNACFTLKDPGIYRVDPSSGRFNFADALIGDHTHGLLTIRRAMYPGQPYGFKVTCQEGFCREPIHWDVQLEDLPIRKLPEATRQAIEQGHEEFLVELRGTKVWFQLIRGRDQMKRHKLIQQVKNRAREDRMDLPGDLMLALACRITRAEGLELGAGDADDFDAKVSWLEGRPTSDHMRLLRAFEKVDCGVDTKIEIVCRACGSQQEVELPLDEKFLFDRR